MAGIRSTWNPDLLAAVSGTGAALEWLIEPVIALGSSSGGPSGLFLRGAVYGTAPIPGVRPTMVHRSVQVGASSVSPVSWRANEGSWSFRIADRDRASLAQAFRRGTWYQLKAGLDGMPASDYSPIAIGRVSSVTQSTTGEITVTMWGPAASLGSRPDVISTRSTIHETLTATTVSGGAYTAGDSVINLASVADVKFRVGGFCLLYIEPTVGDPFYLRGTGLSGSQVTGLDSTGSFGTTAVNAANGSAVTPIWYDEGNPWALLLRLLLSTGQGTNGSNDSLPDRWGYALPADVIDELGIKAHGRQLFNPSSGSFTLRLAVQTAPADPGQWLLSWLSRVGAWICTHEGRISMRGAQDITSRGAVDRHTGVVITDDDIIPQASQVEWFATDQPTEYLRARVLSGTGSSQSSAAAVAGTLPNRGTVLEYDLSSELWDNETATRSDLLGRLTPWVQSVGETIQITCRGMAQARRCPGDVVDIASRDLYGRLQRTVVGYGAGIPAMITAVSPNWTQGTTQLRAIVLPQDRNDEWS